MIAIISNEIDNYQNYIFKNNYKQNYKKEIKKCFNYNLKNHPNFFLNQLHYQSLKNRTVIDHYKNIKNKNKIKLFIFLDVVENIETFSKKPKILLIMEYKSIKPFLYERSNHKFFDKVFTFEKSLINNKKYFFFNGLQVITKKTIFLTNKKNQKYCIFFSNKLNENKNLYFQKRLKIIDFFKNEQEKISLYGSNWDKFVVPMNAKFKKKIFFNIVIKFFDFFNFKIKKYNKIWKGYTRNLIKTSSKYKFSFVIENSSTLSGRIFLAFYSGTVPIYFGDTSKIKLIPKSCYINLKNFSTFDQLEKFISKIDINKYSIYRKKIQNFLRSEKYQRFTVENDAIRVFKIVNMFKKVKFNKLKNF